MKKASRTVIIHRHADRLPGKLLLPKFEKEEEAFWKTKMWKQGLTNFQVINANFEKAKGSTYIYGNLTEKGAQEMNKLGSYLKNSKFEY